MVLVQNDIIRFDCVMNYQMNQTKSQANQFIIITLVLSYNSYQIALISFYLITKLNLKQKQQPLQFEQKQLIIQVQTKIENILIIKHTTQQITMSTNSHQQQEQQIMQTCQKINQVLNLPEDQFSLQSLTHIDWYIAVLEIIYPQLEREFDKIRMIEDEAQAIDKMLVMLTQEEIIQEDFLEIKGSDICDGDVESVYYIVQLLNALIQRQGQQQQNDQQQQQQDDQEHQQPQQQQQSRSPQSQIQQHSMQHHEGEQDQQSVEQHQEEDEEGYENDFENDDVSNSKGPESSEHFPSLNPNKFNPDKAESQFKNVFNHYDSQDEPSHQEERHSVLGINNQFQDDEDEEHQHQEDEDEEMQPKNNNMFSNNANNQKQFKPFPQINQLPKQPQKPPQTQSITFPSKIPQNIQPKQSKPQPQLVETGYKIPQPHQKNQKHFSSSEEEEVNFYEQKAKPPQQKPHQKSKPGKQSQSEDENEYFINPTIKKYTSDHKLMKSINSGQKKHTVKKAPHFIKSPQSQPRKLVSHPTVKKHYQKASNPQAKKLTSEVKSHISTLIKKKKPSQKTTNNLSTNNVSNQEMDRKRKQLQVKLKDWRDQNKLRRTKQVKSQSMKTMSNLELNKVLNWREGQLKKEKQQFEKAMELKLQVQKENYIKKINNLILKLEKQKQLQQRNDYKEHLKKQNFEAAKRLTSIEQWYKDRLAMLKQNKSVGHQERQLMHTGHKQILKQIEKDLKRQNQKQIMAMTMKFRKNEADIQNDLEQLERQIIKVYKRN